MMIPISGEERERKQFVVAVKDGCFASESFILFIPSLHCFLNLMGSFTLVNMNVGMNRLLT